jgi:hypothetical protein
VQEEVWAHATNERFERLGFVLIFIIVNAF